MSINSINGNPNGIAPNLNAVVNDGHEVLNNPENRAILQQAKPASAWALAGRILLGVFTLGISEGIRAIVRAIRPKESGEVIMNRQEPRAPMEALKNEESIMVDGHKYTYGEIFDPFMPHVTVQAGNLSKDDFKPSTFTVMIGPAMAHVLRQVNSAALTNKTITIQGKGQLGELFGLSFLRKNPGFLDVLKKMLPENLEDLPAHLQKFLQSIPEGKSNSMQENLAIATGLVKTFTAAKNGEISELVHKEKFHDPDVNEDSDDSSIKLELKETNPKEVNEQKVNIEELHSLLTTLNEKKGIVLGKYSFSYEEIFKSNLIKIHIDPQQAKDDPDFSNLKMGIQTVVDRCVYIDQKWPNMSDEDKRNLGVLFGFAFLRNSPGMIEVVKQLPDSYLSRFISDDIKKSKNQLLFANGAIQAFMAAKNPEVSKDLLS